MHFWRESYFRGLKEVASDAGASPEWADYANFCLEYERGLRGRAFVILEQFLTSIENAPFGQRKRFVSWLLTKAVGMEGRHMLVPHPLQRRLIEPTLLEWTLVEPECSEPHRWLGGIEDLRRAVELDSKDHLARRKLVARILGAVDYATHHLPIGYIGDPNEGLAALREADDLLNSIPPVEHHEEYSAYIEEQRRLIQEYQASR